MILEKQISIKSSNKVKGYYENLGYQNQDGFFLIKIEDLNPNSSYKVKVKCEVCGQEKKLAYHKYLLNKKRGGYYSCSAACGVQKMKMTNLQKYGHECSLHHEENIDKKKQTWLEKYGVDHPMKNDEIATKVSQKLQQKFQNFDFIEKLKKENLKKCGYQYQLENPELIQKIKANNLVNYRLQKKLTICTICHPIKSFTCSGVELQLLEFIQTNYMGEIITNSKQIIAPLELDIYLPELKLAFEFNGLWWHNELNKEPKYHLYKTEACEAQDIQLIHIYEDDWLYKRDIVESRILNLLGQSKRIYARQCKLKEVKDNQLIRQFLEMNHLQSFVGSKVKLGLFYEEQLVSLMTFGQKRKVMNSSSKEGEWELLRFCNQKGYNVIGGASKLFKYFMKTFKPKEIISYADRSWSQGGLYEKLGFKYVSKTPPNYYYVVNGIRKHRFNYRKDKLVKEGFEASKSEHKIMLERGLYRIYDSGSLKFKFTDEI
jgi:nitrite reductase/ring-hydroxylating ferredoxin subunit